ncbi:putative RNA-directed DNA polymerase [Senna tora]|uniref:Putative RNA-directed DNA polymerase n=1 Tax=Senna tora TaxID=362788 RepID=A0A834WMW7_9FABA|nr:putative RNA-directed DNA polymerase [Senna tora]
MDVRRAEMVFREIQYLEEGDVLLTSDGTKENTNPLMKSSGGKQWKRLARNNGMLQVQIPIEQKMGKRKNTTEGAREEEEKALTISKKARSVEEGDGDSNSISAGNLMEARCGYRPSATWRSLMEGRKVLSKGLRRAIGNGRTTGVWTDPWIPAEIRTIAVKPNHIERGEETVSVLLNEDATNWDVEELRTRFDEETCIRIQSIPPDPEQGEDRWVWEYDRKGVYSVKTGYRSMMIEVWSQLDLGLDIDGDATTRLWKKLWKLPIISRYKVFLWRACLGIIPTVESLERRGMIISEDCCMCNNAPEDVFHALVDCLNLQILWVMASFDYSSRVYHANILEWLVVEAVEWSEEKLATLAVAMYHAWERRNKKKFTSEEIRAEDLWPRVERVMDEFQTGTFSDDGNRAEPTRFVWEKPEYPFTKLNVDATGSKEGGGSMGGILRDDTGNCVGAYMHSVLYPNDPTLLEAVAIRKGLEMALKVGRTHVMVESDAKLVIDMLKTLCDQISTLNALCRDILRFCSNFQVVSFNWVPRMSNLIADFISRKAKIDRRNIVWTGSVPLFLSESGRSKDQTLCTRSTTILCTPSLIKIRKLPLLKVWRISNIQERRPRLRTKELTDSIAPTIPAFL